MAGTLRVDGPGASFAIVGVDDGVEVRVDSLKQAWAMRKLSAVSGKGGPLAAVLTWWRASRLTMHLVVAGRRVAVAEPSEPFERRSRWLPAPWKMRVRPMMAAVGAAAVGRG